MTNTNGSFTTRRIAFAGIACRIRTQAVSITAAVLMGLAGGHAAAADAPGTIYSYRVINGYNNEVQGQVVYQIDNVEADRVSVTVTPNTPMAGGARTEIYTREGNWLRHAVVSHDEHVDYEFTTAYPAYVFPLETGKSWSIRVDAMVPATGKRVSVRVDGEVLGTERVRVPAGEFDAIKVRRQVYAGDTDTPLQETSILETDWYVPALNRAVKSQSSSVYRNLRFSRRNQVILGDRPIYELISTSRQAAP